MAKETAERGPITRERVAAGIKSGTIRFDKDPNEMENIVCFIGDYWFYFRNGEGSCDERTVEEYMKQTAADEVIRLVYETLAGFYTDSFDDEYAYYDAVLSEDGI